ASVFRRVLGFSERILFIPLGEEFPRALGFGELEAALSPEERARVDAFPLSPGALEAWLRSTGAAASGGEGPSSLRTDLVVACGSLYLLGKLIPQLTPLYP